MLQHQKDGLWLSSYRFGIGGLVWWYIISFLFFNLCKFLKALTSSVLQNYCRNIHDHLSEDLFTWEKPLYIENLWSLLIILFLLQNVSLIRSLPIEILKVLNIRNNPIEIIPSQSCTGPFTSPQNELFFQYVLRLKN